MGHPVLVPVLVRQLYSHVELDDAKWKEMHAERLDQSAVEYIEILPDLKIIMIKNLW